MSTTEALQQALRLAIRQNSHDMLMTGEEIRQCEAALAATSAPAEIDTDFLRDLLARLNEQYRAALAVGYCPSSEPYKAALSEAAKASAILRVCFDALATGAPAEPEVETAIEKARMAYKTGYDDGYSDASGGSVDHDACEEGWQQYLASQCVKDDDHE